MNKKLYQKVYELPSFKEQFETLLKESVSIEFENLILADTKSKIESDIDYENMLLLGSILSMSENPSHLDSAYRIAQYTISNVTLGQNFKQASAIILQRLSNFPTITLSQARKLLNKRFESKLPLPLRFAYSRKVIQNTITVNEQPILLNDFQVDVFKSYLNNEIISISAPTSAGKSYILSHIILDFIINNKSANIVYIVPTRALISQVQKDITHILSENKLHGKVGVSSVPQIINNQGLISIYIFTQERLHWFRDDSPLTKIDLLIVDEAQSINDKSRGILLQQKIEEVINDFPEVKVIFASPASKNPEVLFKLCPTSKKSRTVQTDFIATNQNLLFVNQVPRQPKLWKVELITKEMSLSLGTINLPARPSPVSKKLPYIAFAMSNKNNPSIIYVNRPADAEKLADQLFDLFESQNNNISSQLNELIKLSSDIIHPRYKLVKSLKQRIAFHYGNMPLIIRSEIERLFQNGDILFLICTSTLLEGVNLPARTIFMRKPTRGISNPLNASDFWNLAGRAGRLGKDFQGNIVCIEPETWKEDPFKEKSGIKIEPALETTLKQPVKLVKYIENDPLPPVLDLEAAFHFYYSKFIQHRKISNDKLNELLIPIFNALQEQISVPNNIILSNVGISPAKQQNLFNYFQQVNNYEDYVPEDPSSSSALSSFENIMKITSEFLSGDTRPITPYSILLINWMRGYKLSKIIAQNWKYWKDRNRTIDTVIRNTMKDIETFCRFEFAKFSKCYVDLLRHTLHIKKRTDLVKLIPNLNIWLEFGVSSKTQVSLISLGLSRNIAVALYEYITDDMLEPQDCIDWIKHYLSTIEISPIFIEEIQRILFM